MLPMSITMSLKRIACVDSGKRKVGSEYHNCCKRRGITSPEDYNSDNTPSLPTDALNLRDTESTHGGDMSELEDLTPATHGLASREMAFKSNLPDSAVNRSNDAAKALPSSISEPAASVPILADYDQHPPPDNSALFGDFCEVLMELFRVMKAQQSHSHKINELSRNEEQTSHSFGDLAARQEEQLEVVTSAWITAIRKDLSKPDLSKAAINQVTESTRSKMQNDTRQLVERLSKERAHLEERKTNLQEEIRELNAEKDVLEVEIEGLQKRKQDLKQEIGPTFWMGVRKAQAH